ncbi:type I-E CRISPR-associated protein Cse2/CasB, partial [Escherichia coli]
ADRNRSHWSTSKTPSYTKSVSWQHHRSGITASDVCCCDFLIMHAENA